MNYAERYGVEPAENPWCPKVLIEEIAETIKTLVIVPEGTELAIALWIVHTYLIDPAGEHQVFRVSPILAINSPDRQCGKSVLCEVVMNLCPRSKLSMNLTESVLFRSMELEQPTLFIDEADTFINKSRDSLIGILNAGYRPDGSVDRMGGKNFDEMRSFKVWGAKVIAGIGDLPDTLSSRCIHIRMKRKLPHERVQRLNTFRRENPDYFIKLCRQLVSLIVDIKGKVDELVVSMPEELDDRQQDNWEPLFKIALACNESLYSRVVGLALTMRSHTPEQINMGVMLLVDVRLAFDKSGQPRISSADLLIALNSDDTRPWLTYSSGRPMSARQVSELLRPYGIGPRDLRINGPTCKGYERADFEDAFLRYLSESATGQQNS